MLKNLAQAGMIDVDEIRRPLGEACHRHVVVDVRRPDATLGPSQRVYEERDLAVGHPALNDVQVGRTARPRKGKIKPPAGVAEQPRDSPAAVRLKLVDAKERRQNRIYRVRRLRPIALGDGARDPGDCQCRPKVEEEAQTRFDAPDTPADFIAQALHDRAGQLVMPEERGDATGTKGGDALPLCLIEATASGTACARTHTGLPVNTPRSRRRMVVLPCLSSSIRTFAGLGKLTVAPGRVGQLRDGPSSPSSESTHGWLLSQCRTYQRMG
jgi:hypothetical protein